MSAARALAALLALSVVSCAGPARSTPASAPSTLDAASPGDSSASGAPSSRPSEPRPSGNGPAASGHVGPLDPDDLEAVLEPFAEGLAAPLDLTHAGDGSGRVYVAEQPGRIRAFESDGSQLADPYLDIADKLTAGGERGLLGLAFHPDFADNGRLFVNYTDLRGDTVIAEYRGDADRADPGSERVLLGIEQPYPNHNGGGLAFDLQGRLLIAMGDGGAGGDPHGNGQSPDALLGKILRIDIDADTDGERPYAIPGDNPFAGGGGRPEILHLGMRNPFRISVDRETGELWMGDVGQGRLEELDRAPADAAGLDFGWNVMEGHECFDSDDCSREGLTLPIVSYGRDLGSVVTGGHTYRGSAQSLLRGVHVFADFASGAIFAIAADAAPAEPITDPPVLAATDLAIADIGEDEAGELYAVDLGGSVWRITARAR